MTLCFRKYFSFLFIFLIYRFRSLKLCYSITPYCFFRFNVNTIWNRYHIEIAERPDIIRPFVVHKNRLVYFANSKSLNFFENSEKLLKSLMACEFFLLRKELWKIMWQRVIVNEKYLVLILLNVLLYLNVPAKMFQENRMPQNIQTFLFFSFVKRAADTNEIHEYYCPLIFF